MQETENGTSQRREVAVSLTGETLLLRILLIIALVVVHSVSDPKTTSLGTPIKDSSTSDLNTFLF